MGENCLKCSKSNNMANMAIFNSLMAHLFKSKDMAIMGFSLKEKKCTNTDQLRLDNNLPTHNL